MHRISGTDAIAGRFNDNPTVQSPTTRVPAAWLNDLQENICQAIEGADVILSSGEGGQLLLAIGKLIDRVQPIGAVVMLDGPNAGWGLVALDTEYPRADYPRLVAHYVGLGRLIAGSTGAHFRTPNYQGYFPRIAATDATVDPDGPRTPGSTQADQNKAHTHQVQPPASTNDTSSGLTVTGTGGSETITAYDTASSGGTEARGKNVAFTFMIRGR